MADIFSQANFDNHEQVIFVTDAGADLRGIIAIHSTALGPAAGGWRMQPYGGADDALNDVGDRRSIRRRCFTGHGPDRWSRRG